MQRKDVERICACAPFADQTAGIPEMVAALRALLDRAERAEEAHDKLAGHLAKALSIIGQLEPRAEKAEAERDAAFAAGQESMRERSLAEIALMREDCHPPRTPLVAAVPIWLDVAAHRIRQLPIKPCPE